MLGQMMSRAIVGALCYTNIAYNTRAQRARPLKAVGVTDATTPATTTTTTTTATSNNKKDKNIKEQATATTMATAVSKWLSEYGRECLFVQVRLNENSIAVPETESEAETQAETGAKAEQEEPTTAAAPTEVTAKRCRQRNATIERKKIERKKD